jgi:hypothetical protein
MSAIFEMAAKTRHKKWAVKIQHCPISKERKKERKKRSKNNKSPNVVWET